MLAKRTAATLVALAIPVFAIAQENGKPTRDGDTSQPGQTQGPMTIERVHSGLLVAPDFKVTRFDGRTSELVGAYVTTID